MKTKDFMDVDNILVNLENNDATAIKDWYENYECGGEEFERMADALCNIDEREFLWQVADYISEKFDETELLEIIKEEEWEWELSPLQRFKADTDDSDCDFVNCTIKYKDSGETADAIIAVGKDTDELADDNEDNPYMYSDEDIFYYAEDIEAVAKLFDENNGEDFVIVEYDSIEY